MMINRYKLIVYFIVLSLTVLCSAQTSQRASELISNGDYEKLRKSELQILQNENKSTVSNNSSFGLPQEALITPYLLQDEKESTYSNYFGYDFFTLRDTVKFWENLPSPPNYLLGPGDQLILSLWGETQLRQSYTISKEGKIYDEKVGLLTLSGKNIDSARMYLKSQFSRVYSTIKGDKPTSFIDVSLGELQSINVNFVGQVNYPGIYPIHPFSSIITGLIQAGGVDTTGTLREITIKRNGQELPPIDLYDYFIDGSLSSLVQLRDQDVIIVPPRISFVKIDSAVVRPGIYESLIDETIYDIIHYAGGPTYDASEKIGIKRIKEKEKRLNSSIYEALYIDYSKSNLITAMSGDEIVINRLFTEVKQVEIIGQVKTPGLYFYYQGMTLIELLKLSSGFEDDTFLKSVYLNSGEIIRRNPKTRYEEVISFSLSKLLKSNKEDIVLNNLDRVVVHANSNFFEKENILITGEVSVPGSYPQIEDNESLSSLISRSGGLTSRAMKDGISIYRKREYFETSKDDNSSGKIRVAWINDAISLMPGDSIIVKEKTSTVLIKGSVYNSGLVEYRKGKRLKYYIDAAGGVKESGNKRGVIVLYPNGLVNPKKWYNNPHVVEGSTIIVSEKVVDQTLDLTQFATNWTSIITSILTTVILSRQL